MPVSPATILRLVRRTELVERATPSLLGVDEWAYRKRLDFKTILVDLSTNRPLDLLPDADASTFATWLQAHLGVSVIARDRVGTFAEGASQGAPDAVQVADRFHLIVRRITHPSIPIADGKGSEGMSLGQRLTSRRKLLGDRSMPMNVGRRRRCVGGRPARPA
jgi:hypothetical protein